MPLDKGYRGLLSPQELLLVGGTTEDKYQKRWYTPIVLQDKEREKGRGLRVVVSFFPIGHDCCC